MYRLLEDQVKACLAAHGIPVPEGVRADSPEAAAAAMQKIPRAVIKALVPTGRRGKAGAVCFAENAAQASAATANLLGRSLDGFVTRAVYVETRVDIQEEFFVSFSFGRHGPRILLSRHGGVEIEQVFEQQPDQLLSEDIDPQCGLPPWRATGLWCRAGLAGDPRLPRLAALTSALYEFFNRTDALTLEINPLVLTQQDTLCVVGAMMAIDAYALYRQPQWQVADDQRESSNPRERSVQQANRLYPGGEAQYKELDGDIGLLVGGGGAGLYIHDLIVEAGGRPANHCVTPPTGGDVRKLKAVLTAILSNPNALCLLVGFNFAQMARADLRLQALAEVLRERDIDTRRFPIVVRLFGAGEALARQVAAEFPGIHYLPRGTSLRDAVLQTVMLSESTSGLLPRSPAPQERP
jgi:succinyl-CoA synthetase beta subunit